jgi:small-conductance mechanosensitive channel
MADKVWRRPFEWAGDTKRHEFLYDAQAVFKVFSGIALGVALVFAFNSWPGTFFFVTVFLVSSALWVTGTLLEHRTRQGLPGPTTEGEAARLEADEDRAASARDEAAERRAARAGTRLALGILAAVVLVAIGTAVLLFDRATLGVGVVLALVWGLVFGAPYWAAAVFDRQDEERRREG